MIFSFAKNEAGGVKSKEVVARAVDGSKTASFILRQLPSGPFIKLTPDKTAVESEAGTHSVTLDTNLDYSQIDVAVNYADEDNKGWVTGTSFGTGEFSFTVTENASAVNKRMANIVLTYVDEFERTAEATLSLTQMFTMDPTAAVQKTIEYAKAIPAGEIAENIYVSGIVVAAGNGDAHNYKSKRYIIQDGTNDGLVFEAEAELQLMLNDGVDLWLLGAEMADAGDAAGFRYPLVKGVAALNILSKDPGQTVTPKQLFMNELTDDEVNTLVTLKDVEVAVPHGGWCNYNSWYLSAEQMANSTYFVRNHPTGLRDINGDFIYSLINVNTSFARTPALPQGSGPITGIVVREENANMGNIGTYQIRPQDIGQIGIDSDRSQGFSQVLAEWDGSKPADLNQSYMRPSFGTATNATFFKNNATSLASAYNAEGNIYFIADYRAGASVANGTMNAANWGTDVWWIIKDISTMGITSQLSLQVETNSNDKHGPKNFVVEWSLDETGWTPVQDGNYIAHGQYVSARRFIDYNPGYKCYNFNLPADLLGKPGIYIRLRCTSTESVNSHEAGNGIIDVSATSRIAHVSLKYNK